MSAGTTLLPEQVHSLTFCTINCFFMTSLP